MRSRSQKIDKNKSIHPFVSNVSSNEEIVESVLQFSELGLSEPLLKAIADIGYELPTQIQAQAVPAVLAHHDLVGITQTGTGKTASFALPILEILSKTKGRARMPRALILEPTRELALQVAENINQYGKYVKLSHALLIGGESMGEQKELLNRGVDIIIATPGRLLDLFDRGGVLLNQTHILVIDEADRMLDMGFIPDVERIITLLSRNRQTLLLSATMPAEIKRLANTFLKNPKEITISPPSSVALTIDTGLVIIPNREKGSALRKLLQQEDVKNAIVFCNRKRDVDTLTRSLKRYGFLVGSLHGDLSQSQRTKTMEEFKNNKITILVCSDIAARGIDIDNLSHVFNFDLPRQAEDYVHRIGRTGRAGRQGHAYSLATPEEKELVDAIEKLTQKQIPLLQIEEIRNYQFESEDEPEKHPEPNSLNKKKKNRKAISKKAENKEVDLLTTSTSTASVIKTMPENDAQVVGFGQFIPAFMLATSHS